MKNYYSILFLLVATFFSSCTEVISVDLPQKAGQLVIEGYISTEPGGSYVKLSKTTSYFSNNTNPPVANAFVMVNSDTFYSTGAGNYQPHNPYKGVLNTTYNLTVISEGNTYTASSTLNPLIQIDTAFTFIHHDAELIAKEGYSISFNFIFKDAYQYTYFRDGFNNTITNGKDSFYDQMVTFDSKNSHYGVWQPFDIPLLRLQPGDTALLYFNSCDENLFNVYNQINNNSRSGSPFSNPPSNLPNNIRGGALGIFAAYEVKRYRIKIAP